MITKTKTTKGAVERKRIVLLDSHAILHRAYHAIPDFSNSRGEPTGALYGLVSTLLRIVDDLHPDYLIATRDLPGPTHRHDVFEEYKGTRAKAEDALVVQLQAAPRVFEAFGIPVYQAAGYEADDCLGTIVREVSDRDDIEIVIASGDMDTLQLVGDTVRVYTMRKGLNDTVLYDADGVRARYGFGPEHIVDYKALRGDPSDNIPGIKGIGEKTATEIIQAFGSIEDLYKAVNKNPEVLKEAGIKPRMIELLKAGEKDALFSRQLATIHQEAPITFVVPHSEWNLANHIDTINAFCDEMEFKSLKERVRYAINKKNGTTVGSREESQVEEVPTEIVDERELKETSVAMWLVNSDISAPNLEDILRFTHTTKFEAARAKIFDQLKKTGRLEEVYTNIEEPLIAITQRMHDVGIYVDTVYLKNLAKEYSKGLGELAGRIYQHAGHEFNINSPKQLGDVLYDELKITPAKQKKTAGGARTTREDELVKLSDMHPIIGDVLAYRELQKLLSTYIEKIPEMVGDDKRLHAQFLQAGTTTGRMASNDPNLQNIPVKTDSGRRIRTAFAAQKGYLLVAIDYSQIELRIAAGLSGDKKLIKVFQEGGDVHAAVASEVFGVTPEHVDREMRRRAKVINFGILYGMGVNALRANLGAGVTRDESAAFLDEYFKNFEGLAAWIEEVKSDAKQNGFTETLFGRRRYFNGFKSTLPGIVAQAERMAVNAPIQGTQADIIKLAMIEADRLIQKNEWRDNVRLVLQVHDELVYEIQEGMADDVAQILRGVMESVAPIKKLSNVPILAEVSIGKNWGELKKVPRV